MANKREKDKKYYQKNIEKHTDEYYQNISKDETKKCSNCKKIKFINKFNKHRQTKDGFKECCSKCSHKREEKYRQKNIEKHTDEYYQSLSGTKICGKCKIEKDISEININRGKGNGLDSQCRECSKKYGREYYKNNSEKAREYYIKNIYRVWATATINNHKRKGFDVIIIIDKLEELAKNAIVCPICDKKLKWEMGKKRNNSPTLDRINNEKILTINNVQILCEKCNATKQNRTIKEFIEYCTKVSNKFYLIPEGAYQFGGIVPKTQAILAHGGEMVLTKEDQKNLIALLRK